jgi:hypothetical protein
MHVKKLLFASAFTILSFALAEASMTKNAVVYSPSRAYSCAIVKAEQGEKIVFASRSNSNSEILLETSRWARPVWSKQDSWFSITDHVDGHMTHLHIYRIDKRNAEPIVSRFWSSPNPTEYDTHWSLVEWNFKHQTARVKCEYQVYADGVPTHKWVTTFLVVTLRD